MEKTSTLPVIFTAFANPKGDLGNLNLEQNGIQDVFGKLEAEKLVKHLLRTDTDLTAYFDFLQHWKNQIVIFHYGGHADSTALSFQNADVFFKPLAEELLRRNKKSLQLVFLNGCSTMSHVQTLFDLNVPAVIATSAAIDDNQAMQFAVRFYGNIAKGDSIPDAYTSAANYIKGNSTELRFRNLGEIQTWRSVGFQNQENKFDFPWGMYVRNSGVLANKSLIVTPKTQNSDRKFVAGTKRITLWVWMAFTILITGLILIQSLNGTLEDIALTAWSWVLVHLYPGLTLLCWNVVRHRPASKPLLRGTHLAIIWFTLLYQMLVLCTLLAEPFLPVDVSIQDHLLLSYIWLLPFNLLILGVYWQLFVRRK